MNSATKFLVCIILCISFLSCEKITGVIEFGGGSGTENRPYKIDNLEQFLKIKDFPNKYYELDSDIDLKNIEWKPFQFAGNLNGNNYTIYNLSIKITESSSNVGLFSEVSGEIKNLIIKNVEIFAESSDYVGAFSGIGGNFTCCKVVFGENSRIVGGNFVGGICGALYSTSPTVSVSCGGTKILSARIKECSVESSNENGGINGTNNYVGGIAGYIKGLNSILTIEDCSVNVPVNGNNYVGGILGCIECDGQNLEMDNLHVKCGISGSNAIGGIIGYSTGRKYLVLQKSSFVGNISGNTMIGGIIGSSTNSDGYSHTDRKPDYDVLIQECMVNASIYASAEIAGGVVGTTPSYGSLYVIGCYSNGDIHAKEQVGGIIGGENYENAILCFSTMNSSSASFTGLGYNVGGKDCATTTSKLSNKTCSNSCGNCKDITTFLKESYSDYASCWNFNNTWTWEGEIDGKAVKVSCPKLSWE